MPTVQQAPHVPNTERVVVHLRSSGTLFTTALAPEVPEDRKAAQCRKIYEWMQGESLTSPKGYLILDVFAEWCKAMGEFFYVDIWPFLQRRFVSLLSSAPESFRIFASGGRQGFLRVAICREAYSRSSWRPAFGATNTDIYGRARLNNLYQKRRSHGQALEEHSPIPQVKSRQGPSKRKNIKNARK
jgi:hypothetical protein